MTLSSFPGAFFIVSAAITVPLLGIFAWFYWQVRKEQQDQPIIIQHQSNPLQVTNSSMVTIEGNGDSEDSAAEEGSTTSSSSSSSNNSSGANTPVNNHKQRADHKIRY